MSQQPLIHNPRIQPTCIFTIYFMWHCCKQHRQDDTVQQLSKGSLHVLATCDRIFTQLTMIVKVILTIVASEETDSHMLIYQ